MGKGLGIGHTGVYRRVKDIEIGLNGVAHRVKRGYIGVNGVARLFYEYENWYIPDGYAESNIVAAYRFRDASSLDSALTNLVDPVTYKLTKDGAPSWNKATGMTFPMGGTAGEGYGLVNTELWQRRLPFVILHFQRPSGGKRRLICNIGPGWHVSFGVYLPDGSAPHGFKLGIGAGRTTWFGGDGAMDAYIGVDFKDHRLYFNDHQAGVHATDWSGSMAVNTGRILGGQISPSFANETSLTITGAAFYTQAMSLEQYKSVQRKMAVNNL